MNRLLSSRLFGFRDADMLAGPLGDILPIGLGIDVLAAIEACQPTPPQV